MCWKVGLLCDRTDIRKPRINKVVEGTAVPSIEEGSRYDLHEPWDCNRCDPTIHLDLHAYPLLSIVMHDVAVKIQTPQTDTVRVARFATQRMSNCFRRWCCCQLELTRSSATSSTFSISNQNAGRQSRSGQESRGNGLPRKHFLW